MQRRVQIAVAAIAAVASALLAGTTAATTSGASVERRTTSAPSTLREAAAGAGLRIGATVDPSQLGDADHTGTLAREFSSVTAENAMKWYSIEATRDVETFEGADAILAFAEANDLDVRGHNLVWAQDAYTPAWVKQISDRAELQQEVDDHLTAVLERYRGRIGRWDVVNEPLASGGAGRSDNVFERVLGPDWIARAYRLAHEVDPDAELWLNEYGSDWIPGKHEALLALLRDLLDQGVPIDGIGLQTHRITVDGPDRARFDRMLQDYADLGLRVAITELDVATRADDPDALERQADAYRTIVSSCLAQPACEEVTTWGVSDRDTWLDSMPGLFDPPTRPLLFDDEFRPKPAYDAVLAVLAAGRSAATTTTTTTNSASQPTPQPVAPPTTSAREAAPATPVAAGPAYTG